MCIDIPALLSISLPRFQVGIRLPTSSTKRRGSRLSPQRNASPAPLGNPVLRTLGVGGSEAPLGRSAPGAPPARRGSPFLPRNGEKEGRGCAPGPRGSWPAHFRSLVLGIVVPDRIEGLFPPVCQNRFGTHFSEKYAGKHFCERRFPNQGTRMGTELAQPPSRCAPPRQNERVGTSGP